MEFHYVQRPKKSEEFSGRASHTGQDAKRMLKWRPGWNLSPSSPVRPGDRCISVWIQSCPSDCTMMSHWLSSLLFCIRTEMCHSMHTHTHTHTHTHPFSAICCHTLVSCYLYHMLPVTEHQTYTGRFPTCSLENNWYIGKRARVCVE